LLFDWLTSPSSVDKRARVQNWLAKYTAAQDQLHATSAFIKYTVEIEQQEAVLEITWQVLREVTELQLWQPAYPSLKEFKSANNFDYIFKRMLIKQGITRARQVSHPVCNFFRLLLRNG